MKIKSILLGLFVFALATGSQAQTRTPKVDKKQYLQQKRISNGVKEGKISRKEAHSLKKQQRHINRAKKRAKADGVVTKPERAKLHVKQKRARRHIASKKHYLGPIQSVEKR